MCTIFVIGLLSGCKKEVSYNFIQDQSEIDTIEIIEVGEPDLQGVNEQISICTIEDTTSFMGKFNQMKCYDHYGDPIGVLPDTIAIKILYSNGEYELITPIGQARYTKKRQYKNYVGYRSFDNEEFNGLVSQYIDQNSEY